MFFSYLFLLIFCKIETNLLQGSSDSGKGCSEAASPPPANINMVPSEAAQRVHQFVIPQTLVGLLIGKHGSFVTQIKAKTGACVYVKRHPDSVKQKICAVEGDILTSYNKLQSSQLSTESH